MAGAPGAVLLYAILAVLLWPTVKSTAGSFVASQPIGTAAAKIIWFVLWAGLAALNFEPANLDQNAVHSMVDGMGNGQPGWLAIPIKAFTAISSHHGTVLTVMGSVVLLMIAIGIFLPQRGIRVAVIAAIIVSAFIWVIGEALGGIYGGQGTDVNSGPLLALLALAYWPRQHNAPKRESGEQA